MRIIITGASGGIGSAVAERYLSLGHEVCGIDVAAGAITHPRYKHYTADVKDASSLPEINGAGVIFSNAGTQNSEDDIGNNLRGAMNVVEKYAKGNEALVSVLFNASASAVSGQEFPEYTASKAGLLGYMRNCAIRLAPRGVTCNAISLGGVYTKLNDAVMNDKDCWDRIMAVTPFKKWTTVEEVADWVEFLTLKNKSMSGQNILIDNGEKDLNPTFVWPE